MSWGLSLFRYTAASVYIGPRIRNMWNKNVALMIGIAPSWEGLYAKYKVQGYSAGPGLRTFNLWEDGKGGLV